MPRAQVARSARCIDACTATEATTLPLPPALPLPLLLTAAEATTLPLPPALPLPLLLQLLVLLIPRAPGSSVYERTVHWGVLEHSPRARCGVERRWLVAVGGDWRWLAWLVVVGWVGLLLS